MVEDLSKPLEALPGFLSTISMVEDDQAQVIKGFIGAERKSPPRYDAARQLILRVLEGQISLQQARDLADTVSDPVDRRCAQQVLRPEDALYNMGLMYQSKKLAVEAAQAFRQALAIN